MVTCPGQRTTSGAGLALLGNSISVVFLLQVPSLWASRNSHLCLSSPLRKIGITGVCAMARLLHGLGMPTACVQQVLLPHGALSPALDYQVSDLSLLCSQCLCVNVGVCTPRQRSEDNLRGQVSPSTSMGFTLSDALGTASISSHWPFGEYLSTAMQSKLWLHSGLLVKLALHAALHVSSRTMAVLWENQKIAIKKMRTKFKIETLNLKYLYELSNISQDKNF